jgi:hypothetical protein
MVVGFMNEESSSKIALLANVGGIPLIAVASESQIRRRADTILAVKREIDLALETLDYAPRLPRALRLVSWPEPQRPVGLAGAGQKRFPSRPTA